MSERATESGFAIMAADPAEPSVARLLRVSEEYAHSLYPPESVHILSVDELRSENVRFLVARDRVTGEALGCCAVVLGKDDSAEIKRMFVEAPRNLRAEMRLGREKADRRRGVGAELMIAAERVAREAGIKVLRFETGPLQPHAIALGHRFGYAQRGPFGGYPDDPNSVFMEKVLCS